VDHWPGRCVVHAPTAGVAQRRARDRAPVHGNGTDEAPRYLLHGGNVPSEQMRMEADVRRVVGSDRFRVMSPRRIPVLGEQGHHGPQDDHHSYGICLHRWDRRAHVQILGLLGQPGMDQVEG